MPPAEHKRTTYDPQYPLRALFLIGRSIIPSTLRNVELWFFLALHVFLAVFRYLKDEGHPAGFNAWGTASLSSVAIPGSLLAFFTVFYNSQCYNRFLSFHTACYVMAGSLMQLIVQMKAHMPHAPEAQWDVTRYIVANILLIYFKVEVSHSNEDETPTIDDEEWSILLATHVEGSVICPPLLTRHEADLLKSTPMLPVTLFSWAARVLREHQVPHYHESIFSCRSAMSLIVRSLAMPIPFPYYHMLSFIMFVCYTLFAFAFTSIPITFSPVLMFITLLIFTGLRELAAALSNPFGTDEVDFPIGRYMRTARHDFSCQAGVAGGPLDANALGEVTCASADNNLSPEAQVEALHQFCRAMPRHPKNFAFPPQLSASSQQTADRSESSSAAAAAGLRERRAVKLQDVDSPLRTKAESPTRQQAPGSPLTPADYYRDAQGTGQVRGYNWATGRYYFTNDDNI